MNSRALAIAIPALLASTPTFAQSPSIWQGIYLGVHAGGSWNGLWSEDTEINVDPEGAIGGIHGGYNWQSGAFVFGLEADVSASKAKWVLANPVYNEKFTLSSSYHASLRARAGIASGSALFYVTGGAAATNLKTSQTAASDIHYSLNGWVIGAGMEYKLTSSVAFRLEGLYNRFIVHSKDAAVDADFKASMLRAGLSYKF